LCYTVSFRVNNFPIDNLSGPNFTFVLLTIFSHILKIRTRIQGLDLPSMFFADFSDLKGNALVLGIGRSGLMVMGLINTGVIYNM